MTIRSAKISDIPAILELLEQILYVHHVARPDLFKEKGGKYSAEELANLMSDEKSPIFVYEDDEGQILGHLFLKIKEATSPVQEPIKTLFIDDLCVSQLSRGQGLGERFYQFALDYAKKENCYNLTLDVLHANEGALRFYERLGLVPQMSLMEKILD